MKDKTAKHLDWIYKRMIEVHKENAQYDYMRKFSQIISDLESKEVKGEENKTQAYQPTDKVTSTPPEGEPQQNKAYTVQEAGEEFRKAKKVLQNKPNTSAEKYKESIFDAIYSYKIGEYFDQEFYEILVSLLESFAKTQKVKEVSQESEKRYELFEYFAQEHNITMLESDIVQVFSIAYSVKEWIDFYNWKYQTKQPTISEKEIIEVLKRHVTHPADVIWDITEKQSEIAKEILKLIKG